MLTLPTHPDYERAQKGRELVRSLGEFLNGYEWAHFATLTFRQESIPDYARRQFLALAHKLDREADRPTFWFYGTEYGARTGRLHLHALFGNTERLSDAQLQRAWPCGFSKFLEYDPARGASGYVAKYVTKELADYDVSPNFPRAIAAHGAQHVFAAWGIPDRAFNAAGSVSDGQRPKRPRGDAATATSRN